MQKVRRLQPNGELGPWEYIGVGETPEEKMKRLEDENTVLRESLMETSLYMANQAEQLNRQNEAIMEISTMVALSFSTKGGDA